MSAESGKIRVAVGSLNPVKVAAATAAWERLQVAVEILPTAVSSGISAMPTTAVACLTGAQTRAQEARAQHQATFGLGLEGGLEQTPVGHMLVGWVAVVHHSGQISHASTGRLPLPPRLVEAVLAGTELGPLMDAWSGREKINHQEGTVGILTGGMLSRTELFTQAILLALAPFCQPFWYDSAATVEREPLRWRQSGGGEGS